MITSIDPNQVGEGLLTGEEEIYKENILDHYKNPHNYGTLEPCTIRHHEHNPLCGDQIELFLCFENGVCTAARFVGTGCAISQASVSMLTDAIANKTIHDIQRLSREDILQMLGIPIGVVRLKCALLSLKTLQRGLAQCPNL